ncbi:MAG: transposase, partial [Betaproteobacteria bacterium]|nr:transposase [Betaproteobacteria bacterium]
AASDEGCLRRKTVQGRNRRAHEDRADKESRLNLFTHLLTRPQQWRIHYNTVRPHRSIGRRPPAPASWTIDSTTHHALHQSLFPPIPTPQEVNQRLNLH